MGGEGGWLDRCSQRWTAMKRIPKSGVLIPKSGVLMTIVLGLGSGCAATQIPQELTAARSAYARVQPARVPPQSMTGVQFDPDEVHAAKVALDKAEASFLDSPSAEETRDLAYVALKKAELAEAHGTSSRTATEIPSPKVVK
jgi:hypothetical protein